MSVKRRDNKNRILRNGESQRSDGRYVYVYVDGNGKQKFLYSWKLELEKTERKTIMDKLKVHSFNSVGRNIETVKAIAQMKPYYAIFLDSGMANDSIATNFEQGCETYGSDTVRKVL